MLTRSLLAALIAATLTAAPSWANTPGVVTVPRYNVANHHVWRIEISGRGGDYHAYGGWPKGQQWLGVLRSRAQDPHTRRVMRRMTINLRDRWRFARRMDRITPFQEFAIPAPIVGCESNYSYAPPTGITGYGVYALISWEDYDWGRPEQFTMPSPWVPRWAQHIVAHRMWVARGWQPWSASRHCWG